MNTEKLFHIVEFAKEIKVVASEWDGEELVSGCEYRKRKTAKQISFEVRKWESKGYRQVGV